MHIRRVALVVTAVLALVVSSFLAVPSPSAFASGTGGVTGLVYLGGTSKLAGAGEVSVVAMPEGGSGGGVVFLGGTTTSAGRYTVTGIPAGVAVQLYFSYLGSQGYSSEWLGWLGSYSTRALLPNATGILVSQYSINQDWDVTLHANSTATGLVTLGATATPATNLTVTWRRLDEETNQYDLPAGGTVQTNSSGVFSLVLQSGQYQFSYQPPDSSYFSTQIQTVIVDNASTDFSYALSKLGTISGRVTLGYGGQIAGAGQVAVTYTCSVQPACQSTPATTYTDQYGDYAIANLPSPSWGYFNLTFTPVNGVAFVPGTLAVDINDPSVGAQGANVMLLPSFIISGTVDLGTASQPAGANAVTVYAGGFSTKTRADGSYSITVPSGNYYVEFVPSDTVDYPNAWWATGNNAGVSSQATLISTGAGASNINMVLPAAVYISGTVTRTDGSAVPTGEQFLVYRDGDNANDGTTDQYETRTGGAWSIGPVLPGDYKVNILANTIQDPLEPTFVGATVADPGAIRTITATAGQTISDADAVQFEDTRLTLNVTCSNCTGTVAAAAQVIVQRWDPTSQTWESVPSNGGYLPGYYWPTLLPGTYRPDALVDHETYQSEYGPSFTVTEGEVLTVSFTFALARPVFRTLPAPIKVSGVATASLAETPAAHPVSSDSAPHAGTLVFGPVAPGQISPAAAA
jgi:hypothetical protein